jgi:hypothetical protein
MLSKISVRSYRHAARPQTNVANLCATPVSRHLSHGIRDENDYFSMKSAVCMDCIREFVTYYSDRLCIFCSAGNNELFSGVVVFSYNTQRDIDIIIFGSL